MHFVYIHSINTLWRRLTVVFYILSSTLDKESLAHLLDLLYESPIPVVDGKLSYHLDGGESRDMDGRFFILDEKPGKEVTKLNLFVLDKDISKHGSSTHSIAIARYKVAIEASHEAGQWIIHSCRMEKLPKAEKRILKRTQQEHRPYTREQTITAEIRKGDALEPLSMATSEQAFFTTKKFPGRNIKMFCSELKYQDKWRIKNLVEWSLAICLDLHSNIHKKGWLHRDIKPANVVINPNDTRQAKLIDLEYATEKTIPHFSLVGTQGYIATELYLAEHQRVVEGRQEVFPYTEKSDIFALGFTIAALMGNTSIEDVLIRAKAKKFSQLDFINAMAEIPLYEESCKRFKNLFLIQGVDIFKEYPNPKKVDDIKGVLLEMLMAMSHPDVNERPSLKEVIDILCIVKMRIKRDYKRAIKNDSQAQSSEEAPRKTF